MMLTFLGATQTVTGSKYLIENDHKKILIDCGLFQGLKELRLRNWDKLPIDPKQIDAVILTHAHIDHSGYIPLLVKKGFRGKIYCSPATYDLCKILLPDSGFLQEEEAAHANKTGSSKHHPALPLYTKEDAEIALGYFHPVDFGLNIIVDEDLSFSLHHAGHILGAAFVLIKNNENKLLFSGDLGRPHDPIMIDPAIMEFTDYLVLESTYGDRLHDETKPQDQLADVINKTAQRHGNIIVPSFAVGRAQLLLYYLSQLKAKQKIPDLPIYLDSPMAVSATEIFCRHPADHKLSLNQCKAIFSEVNYINDVEASKRLDEMPHPIIIISASGMATGGRILHHLKTFLPDSKNTILFTGYQAEGTRGDRLIKGEKEIKIFGEMIPVRAEVFNMNNLSAHADYQETIEWLRGFVRTPKKVFLTHGEVHAAQSLKEKIENTFRWNCEIPHYLFSALL